MSENKSAELAGEKKSIKKLLEKLSASQLWILLGSLFLIAIISLFISFYSGVAFDENVIVKNLKNTVSVDSNQIYSISLKDFLERRLVDSLFDESASNIYIVGLTDNYLRTNNLNTLTKALNRGIQIKSFLYLPEDTTALALQEYLSVQDRYKPNANMPINGLNAMWTTLSPVLIASGSSTVDVNNSAYYLSFYSDRPIGFMIFTDVDEVNYSCAKEVLWFPYFMQAQNMDRPGLSIKSSSNLGRELLRLVKYLNEKGRPADERTINWWRREINKEYLKMVKP